MQGCKQVTSSCRKSSETQCGKIHFKCFTKILVFSESAIMWQIGAELSAPTFSNLTLSQVWLWLSDIRNDRTESL